MSKTIRIRTTPNGDDKFIKINMEQDFDFVEILSLKISQKDLYTTFCAGYGAIVGRVSVNGGFGVPNAKVSVFIPVSDLDRENDKIFGLYPFETISDKGPNGLRYNLLSKENQTNDDCFTPVGDFPDKRTFLDDDTMLDIYCEYYKFTTTTNAAGDYMIFGVPTGAQIMHAEADVSDIGIISQKPFDFIRKGASEEIFESTTKFRDSDEDLDFNTQIISRSPIGVNVQPYWGDEDTCNVAITRRDIDLKAAITPQAIFMGSIFGDSEINSINIQCRPSNNLGILNDQTAGTGRIEMVRKTIAGNIERFDIGGAQLIDNDGTWAYQIPMNLDYRVTDEFGNLVPTDDPKKGIPTRAKVRFRIKMDITGGEGNLRERAAYLVPNNPLTNGGSKGRAAYEFGPNTSDDDLAELTWNTIYSVKNFIQRVQKTKKPSTPTERTFLGIKDVDSARGKYTPFPYNHLNFETDSLFGFLCGLSIALTSLVTLLNISIIHALNLIVKTLNIIITIVSLGFAQEVIPYIPCVRLKCNNEAYAPGCCSSNSSGGPCNVLPFPRLGCDAAKLENPDAICIGDLQGENEFFNTLPPGDAGWVNCTALSLAEDLNLFQFDFYNDWVNGTLYSPLFNVKIKDGDTGPHRFCEWSSNGNPTDLSVDNDNVNGFDNEDYNDLYVIETCIGNSVPCGQFGGSDCGEFRLSPPPVNNAGIKRVGFSLVKNGLIVYYDNQYYYASALRDHDDLILATDIIMLGSSVKCHWLGLPSIYELFVDTTYKLPPYLDYKENGTTLVSGMDSVSNSLGDSLFFEINCFFTRTNARTCGNVRRQCELGVGLDELRPNSNPDDKLTADDIDVQFSRNVFAWMNDQQLQNIYPSPFNLNFDFDSEPSCGSQNGTPDYNRFRYNWIDANNTGTLCRLRPATYNSFYFYFGLNRNKTALSKMLSKYFAPCPIKEKPDFLIIGDTTDSTVLCNNGAGNGEINVSVQGGTPPYTYFWTYPDNTQVTISGNTNPLLDDPDLEDLCGGSYTLTVIDSNGLSSTITFIVGEPQPVSCLTQAIPTTAIGESDGIINVFINGGVGPYTMDISPDPNNVYPQSNLSAGQQVINNLPIGSYTVTVTDSNNEQSTCTADIIEPQGLSFLLNHEYNIGDPNNPNDPEDPNSWVFNENTFILTGDLTTELDCSDSQNGTINVDVLTGIPPFSVTTTNSNGDAMSPSIFNAFTFNGLSPDIYTVQVEDNTGAIETQTIELVGGVELFIWENQPYGPPTTFDDDGSGNGQIIFSVSPATIGETIFWQLLDVNGNIVNLGNVLVNQNPAPITITGITANDYTIIVRNEVGCVSDGVDVTVDLA